MKKLVVIGMGYVGIPAAALFADSQKLEVIGIQRRSKRSGWKIDFLNEGRSPVPENEPGMADLIHRVVKEKKSFRVTDNFEEIRDADYVLIDVQTPVEADHQPRYESLKSVT
nr:nucleotide sugar dehydrogenase [Spirochaeta sp.]